MAAHGPERLFPSDYYFQRAPRYGWAPNLYFGGLARRVGGGGRVGGGASLRMKKRRRRNPYARKRKARKVLVKKTDTFNWQEKSYIEVVTNPFGHSHDGYGIGNTHAGRVPDASGADTVALTITSNYSYNGATGTRGVIKLCNLFDGRVDGIRIGHSAAVAAPTGNVVAQYHQLAAADPLILQWRIVGMGLKVNPVSGADNEIGVLQGGITRVGVTTTAVPAYNNYTTLTRELETERIPIKYGMTVRWIPQGNKDFEFQDWADYPTDWGTDETNWRAPTIYFDGITANVTLEISAVVHFEAITGPGISPFAITQSPTSPKWAIIHALVTKQEFAPIVTEGRSFKSFFTKAGRLIGSIASWIARNAPHIVAATTAVAKIAV